MTNERRAIAPPALAGALIALILVCSGAYIFLANGGSSGSSSTLGGNTSGLSSSTSVSSPSASESTTSTNGATSTRTSSIESQVSTTCSTTTPALFPIGFSNDTSTPDVAQLFASYSGMSVSLAEVSTGTVYVSQTYTQYDTSLTGTTSVRETYSVVFASATTFKVDISEIQGQGTLNATAWVLRNGTAVAYAYLGQNITGSEASGLYEGLMTPFFLESEYGVLAQTLTSANDVQPASEGTVQFGPTTVALTNYTAESLPLIVAICGGSLALSNASIQIGAVRAANLSLLTAINVSGSETYHSQTNQIISLSFRLLSFQDA